MINKPKVEILYLVNYDIVVTGNLTHELSNPKNLSDEKKVAGKKGFHLSGGAVDNVTNEVSGCIMDGTYTFYDAVKKYNGIMGDELSLEDYTFTNPQYIDIAMEQANTYLKSIVLYFDPIAMEFAKKIVFDDNPSKVWNNNKLIFMRSFGEDSTLTEVRCTFTEWSKKNALVKLIKVKTGVTGIYDPQTIKGLFFTREKFSDVENLKFGVSKQTANIKLFDNDGMIQELYKSDLIFKNIEVQIYFDGLLESSYIIESKGGSSSIDYWQFDCKDILSAKLEEKILIMNVPIDGEGQPIPKPLTFFIDYAIGSQMNIIYDEGLKDELDLIIIPIPFVTAGQTRYDLLLKCCQVGLLRMFSDKFQNIRISRGV